MECCLLCLELNKDILDSIEVNSGRWQELGITNVLEKHFWSMSSIYQPNSWICSSCWQEVDNFHKFYLRVEEAHMNFGKVKIEEGSNWIDSKEEISQDTKDLAYCLDPEVLIDENALQTEIVIDENSIKQEGDKLDLNQCATLSKDPLKKSESAKRKNTKNSQLHDIKKESIDSDNNDYENSSEDGDDSCSYEPDKNHLPYKNYKESDKFIEEHFKQMFCDICDVPFLKFNDLRKHFFSAHSIRKGYLVCCNRKFYQRSLLVDHLQCHLNPDHFKCTQCGKVLSDKESLRGHMLRVHRQEDIVSKHTCDICGKYFPIACVLRTHKLTHLTKEEKKFPCTQCGKFYASSSILKLHIEVVHLKKHAKVCYICGKTMGTSTEYKAHMNKHEDIPSPVINCDVCGLRLISERSLKLHKESQHPVGGKKDHPCPLCDKVSPTARALKKHINTMHEKGINHKCTLCEKVFRRAEALKDHMASHTGTPLYTCPWCPKTFNSNGNMHAHRKKMHPKEWEEAKFQKYSENFKPNTVSIN